MLHSCDAGEYAVITAYAPGFEMEDIMDGYSKANLLDLSINAMRWY